MHFILLYEKAADHAERQKPHQAAHLEYLRQFAAQGTLKLAGNLENPADVSAMLLFEAESAETVETCAKNDPYVIHGIVARWTVRKWDTVIGNWMDD